MSEQPVQPQQPGDVHLKAAQFTGVVFNEAVPTTPQYQVSIADSISRILTTRIGERVMRPAFGSNLYLLRDRDFSGDWRIKATRYIYEAINRWEPRVIFKRLRFNIDALTGQHTFYLDLDPRV